MQLPTFEQWFSDTHFGRSFDEINSGFGMRQDAYLMRYMQEIAKYTQAMAQLTHDTLIGIAEGKPRS